MRRYVPALLLASVLVGCPKKKADDGLTYAQAQRSAGGIPAGNRSGDLARRNRRDLHEFHDRPGGRSGSRAAPDFVASQLPCAEDDAVARPRSRSSTAKSREIARSKARPTRAATRLPCRANEPGQRRSRPRLDQRHQRQGQCQRNGRRHLEPVGEKPNRRSHPDVDPRFRRPHGHRQRRPHANRAGGRLAGGDQGRRHPGMVWSGGNLGSRRSTTWRCAGSIRCRSPVPMCCTLPRGARRR